MNSEPDEQVARYLDGTLTPAEQADLDGRLRSDPALRRELLWGACLEAELRRVVREQAAARQRRFRRRVLPLGLAALLVLQIGGWLWLNRTGAARETQSAAPQVTGVRSLAPALGVVVALSGEAQTFGIQGDSAWQTVVSGRVVRAGDRLRVGTNAVVVFRYADGSKLRVYPRSDLTLDATNGAKRVWVRSGALDAEITPQPAGQPMEVATAGLAAIVRGTEFRVLSDDSAVWLGVRRGRVEVVRVADRQVVALTKGQYVATAKGFPFAQLPTTCPFWQAQCVARTGASYR
jgi:ferric-dicitrate binding protein FerR (iron transport regulator)